MLNTIKVFLCFLALNTPTPSFSQAQTDKHHTRNEIHEKSHQAEPYALFSITVDNRQPININKSTAQSEKESTWYAKPDWWVAIGTFLLFIATFGLWIFTALLWKEATADRRPKIIIRELEMIRPGPNQQFAAASFSIVNIGNIPAIIVEAGFFCAKSIIMRNIGYTLFHPIKAFEYPVADGS